MPNAWHPGDELQPNTQASVATPPKASQKRALSPPGENAPKIGQTYPPARGCIRSRAEVTPARPFQDPQPMAQLLSS